MSLSLCLSAESKEMTPNSAQMFNDDVDHFIRFETTQIKKSTTNTALGFVELLTRCENWKQMHKDKITLKISAHFRQMEIVLFVQKYTSPKGQFVFTSLLVYGLKKENTTCHWVIFRGAVVFPCSQYLCVPHHDWRAMLYRKTWWGENIHPLIPLF